MSMYSSEVVKLISFSLSIFVMYCIYCFMYFFVYKIVVVTDGQKVAKKLGSSITKETRVVRRLLEQFGC